MITIQRYNIVKVIEDVCDQLGITQRTIYDAAGVNHNNHAKWKNGGVSPNRATEDRLLDAIEKLQKRKQRARK